MEAKDALKKYDNKRKKGSNNVDRRASKGRKIRYVAHKKLENFMFPIPKNFDIENSQRLFSSLFQ